MKNIIHLTTAQKWRSIRKSGFLNPLSNPWRDCPNDGSLSDVVRLDKYVVGIPEGRVRAWRRYGQFKELKDYISKNYPYNSPKEIVALNIPVMTLEGFVREYLFRTPKYINSVLPYLYEDVREFYLSSSFSGLTKEQRKIYEDLVRRSMFSAIPIKDYDDQFEVPEVWLHQITPINLIKQINILGIKNQNTR